MEIPFAGEHPLAAAMAGLPAHYREVLLLRYDNVFSVKEIASMLGISQSGVRKLIGRAKKALQARLEKETEVV